MTVRDGRWTDDDKQSVSDLSKITGLGTVDWSEDKTGIESESSVTYDPEVKKETKSSHDTFIYLSAVCGTLSFLTLSLPNPWCCSQE